jgi:cytochrome c5
MRHLVVRRLTMLLAGLVLVSALAFAWLVRDEPAATVPAAAAPAAAAPPAPPGAALFDRYCTPCHAAEDLRRPLREGGAATRTAWQALLADHGRSSSEEDLLILDFLAGGG